MKVLELMISKEGIKWGPEREKMDGVECSIGMIKDVVLSYASTSKKFGEDDRRIFYKVCDKFDALKKARKAGEIEDTTVEFEDAEMGFIRKVFRDNTGILPTEYVRRVEENIWAVKDR